MPLLCAVPSGLITVIGFIILRVNIVVMLGMKPEDMVAMLKAQGVDAKMLEADRVLIKMGKKTLELSRPQITVIRLNGGVSYTINCSESDENEV